MRKFTDKNAAKRKFINSAILAIFVNFCAATAFSQVAQNVPDSASIRKNMVESWLTAPLSALRRYAPSIETTPSGDEFQIRMEESETTFSIIVAPKASITTNVYSDSGMRSVVETVYPADAQGAWVLARSKDTGNPIRARYYFSPDSEVFAQFTPVGNTAYGDFVIFNACAVRQIPTGVPFDYFYTASLADVVSLTRRTLPWRYAENHSDMYDAVRTMIATIRNRLSNLTYADDAMYDEFGNPVSVQTGRPRETHDEDAGKLSLSAAGFLKWIADGLVYPITEGGLLRPPLLRETISFNEVGFQGITSAGSRTSFALDWTRNLAAAVLSVYTGRTYLYANSGVDMTEEPFTAELVPEGIRNTAGYVKDSGYNASMLRPLMYAFASNYPGELYFAAVRETDRSVSPEVQFFNECAAIFPYFDADGRFQCAVFRNGAEYTLDEFSRVFYGNFVHLVRVRASQNFDPQ